MTAGAVVAPGGHDRSRTPSARRVRVPSPQTPEPTPAAFNPEKAEELSRLVLEEHGGGSLQFMHERSLVGRIQGKDLVKTSYGNTRRDLVIQKLVEAFDAARLRDEWLVATISLLDRFAVAQAHAGRELHCFALGSTSELDAQVLAATLCVLKLSSAEAEFETLSMKDLVFKLNFKSYGVCKDALWKMIIDAELQMYRFLDYQVSVPSAADLNTRIMLDIVAAARKASGDGASWPGLLAERAKAPRPEWKTQLPRVMLLSAYLIELGLVHLKGTVYGARAPPVALALAAAHLAYNAFGDPPAPCTAAYNSALMLTLAKYVAAEEKDNTLQPLIEALHRCWKRPPSDSKVVMKWRAREEDFSNGRFPEAPESPFGETSQPSHGADQVTCADQVESPLHTPQRGRTLCRHSTGPSPAGPGASPPSSTKVPMQPSQEPGPARASSETAAAAKEPAKEPVKAKEPAETSSCKANSVCAQQEQIFSRTSSIQSQDVVPALPKRELPGACSLTDLRANCRSVRPKHLKRHPLRDSTNTHQASQAANAPADRLPPEILAALEAVHGKSQPIAKKDPVETRSNANRVSNANASSCELGSAVKSPASNTVATKEDPNQPQMSACALRLFVPSAIGRRFTIHTESKSGSRTEYGKAYVTANGVEILTSEQVAERATEKENKPYFRRMTGESEADLEIVSRSESWSCVDYATNFKQVTWQLSWQKGVPATKYVRSIWTEEPLNRRTRIVKKTPSCQVEALEVAAEPENKRRKLAEYPSDPDLNSANLNFEATQTKASSESSADTQLKENVPPRRPKLCL